MPVMKKNVRVAAPVKRNRMFASLPTKSMNGAVIRSRHTMTISVPWVRVLVFWCRFILFLWLCDFKRGDWFVVNTAEGVFFGADFGVFGGEHNGTDGDAGWNVLERDVCRFVDLLVGASAPVF